MDNKIALVYDNNEYTITVNGKILETVKNAEDAFAKYQQIIRNNNMGSATAWEYVVNSINEFKNISIEVNNEFKTVSYEKIKYFHATNKVLYISDKMASPLIGGFNLFMFVANLADKGLITDLEGILEVCKQAIENKVNYRIADTSLTLTSPIFNYGFVEYNFSTGKINKGIIIEKAAFNEFKDYVFSII